MKKRIFTVLKFLLFLGLGILIIWLSIRGLDDEQRSKILESFGSANYFWVLAAITSGIVSHMLRALRWKMLLQPLNYKPSFKNTFLAVMLGYFANLAFPRLGEISKCGALQSSDRIPMNVSIGTVVTERALDLLIFFLLFVVVFFTQVNVLSEHFKETIFPKLGEKYSFLITLEFWLIAGFIMIAAFVALFLLIKKAKPKNKAAFKAKELVIGFWEGLKSLVNIRNKGLFILYTLIIWVLYFLMLYFCFFSFSETSSLGVDVAIALLVLGTIGIMITPGGIGIYPLIIGDSLILYGITKEIGYAYGWLTWTSQTLMVVVLGLISLIWISFLKRKNNIQDTQA